MEGDISIQGVTCGTPVCDAILVTHYHGDHVGMYEKVLPDIPVYMGRAAKEIMHIVQKTVKRKINKGNPEIVDRFKTFDPGSPFSIKDIKITPLMVDHSAFDAYMFLIECEGKKILHTGDFRTHGPRGSKTQELLKKYASDIDLLIIEGTMLSRPDEKVMAVWDLYKTAKELFTDNKYNFVMCSSTNIDSIAAFYNAAISCGKPFIVCEDDFQAEILRTVARHSKSSFYKFNKVLYYKENLNEYMRDKGFCFIGNANRITERAMKEFPENLLIYSMWQGYLNENLPAYIPFKAEFIQQAKARGSRFEYLHTSGHASGKALKMVCETTNAKTILPIHVENPESFTKLGLNQEIKILKDKEVYLL